MAAAEPSAAADGSSWSNPALAAYLAAGRDWRAVEDFLARVVAGEACLSELQGVAAASEPAHGAVHAAAPAEQEPPPPSQQQQPASPSSMQRRPGVDAPQRTTYKLHVAYLGGCFSGWAWQPSASQPSVEGSLAAAVVAAGLATDPPTNRAAARAARRAAWRAAQADAAAGGAQIGAQPAPPAPQPRPSVPAAPRLPAVACAGRTDAGVSACGQVVSFFTWAQPLQPQQLQARLNEQLEAALLASPGAGTAAAGCTQQQQAQQQQQPGQGPWPPLRVWRVEVMPRHFHATYSAAWRRYVYLLPLRSCQGAAKAQLLPRLTPSKLARAQLQALDAQEQARLATAADVDPAAVHALLQPLQGRRLDFHACARDTPQDKAGVCVLHVARAFGVTLPAHATAGGAERVRCLAVELVGDRFLRRMVRVLVATAVREALALPHSGGGGCERLLRLVEAGERGGTAPAAPALGLVFAAAGYG